jgi:hypothetical protein
LGFEIARISRNNSLLLRRSRFAMVRVYERYRRQRDLDEQRWAENLIAEARAEQAKNPMTVEMLKESARATRYGAAQAKKLGIKPKDINRLVHEYRRSRKP